MAQCGPPWRPARQETPSVIGKSKIVSFLCLISASSLLSGCGSTQFAPSNRHIIAAMQTAISAKNNEWLDGVAKQIEEQRAKSAMSDGEYKVLSSILVTAKSGQWD